MTSELDRLRATLDVIDEALIDALKKRVEVVRAIGAEKVRSGLDPRDPNREEVIITRAPYGVIRDCYGAVIVRCRREVERIVEDAGG